MEDPDRESKLLISGATRRLFGGGEGACFGNPGSDERNLGRRLTISSSTLTVRRIEQKVAIFRITGLRHSKVGDRGVKQEAFNTAGCGHFVSSSRYQVVIHFLSRNPQRLTCLLRRAILAATYKVKYLGLGYTPTSLVGKNGRTLRPCPLVRRGRPQAAS